ncbi:hypothetical protein ACFPRL_30035 [Pseudoclavibacter helvolus]
MRVSGPTRFYASGADAFRAATVEAFRMPPEVRVCTPLEAVSYSCMRSTNSISP